MATPEHEPQSPPTSALVRAVLLVGAAATGKSSQRRPGKAERRALQARRQA